MFGGRLTVLAPALMVQGTASNVGKSLLCTALCRLFRQDGLHVLPFKSQNMALNSYVTPEGGEIGRAQAAQAEAAGVASDVDMNPILIKPEGDARSQIVVLGKPVGSMSAAEYHRHKPELRGVVAGCLERLRRRADLVVIEGAGSPAEINLKAQDIVNMWVAREAGARVLLVGDIDRGGVFASFVGTIELLEPEERALVAGFVVNKFRGDLELLRPGLEFLTARTGLPVLGVLPYLPALRLADEDSLALEQRRGRRRAGPDQLDIAVVRLPRIANHDDFGPLEHEPDVVLRFAEQARELAGSDLIIVPGSKSTVADLAWLRSSGMAEALAAQLAAGRPVLGICGGFQMMGRTIEDPEGIEAPAGATAGLGLLPVRTRFQRSKVTARVRARPGAGSFLTVDMPASADIEGYEIHMGRVELLEGEAPLRVVARNGQDCSAPEGASGHGGLAVGTLLHGLFDNDAVRSGLLDFLRRGRGLPAAARHPLTSKETEYDRLAAAVRAHMDVAQLRRIAGIGP